MGGAAMTDGMRYIGILEEAKVIVSVAKELGLFDGVKPPMMSLTRWWQK